MPIEKPDWAKLDAIQKISNLKKKEKNLYQGPNNPLTQGEAQKQKKLEEKIQKVGNKTGIDPSTVDVPEKTQGPETVGIETGVSKKQVQSGEADVINARDEAKETKINTERKQEFLKENKQATVSKNGKTLSREKALEKLNAKEQKAEQKLRQSKKILQSYDEKQDRNDISSSTKAFGARRVDQGRKKFEGLGDATLAADKKLDTSAEKSFKTLQDRTKTLRQGVKGASELNPVRFAGRGLTGIRNFGEEVYEGVPGTPGQFDPFSPSERAQTQANLDNYKGTKDVASLAAPFTAPVQTGNLIASSTGRIITSSAAELTNPDKQVEDFNIVTGGKKFAQSTVQSAVENPFLTAGSLFLEGTSVSPTKTITSSIDTPSSRTLPEGQNPSVNAPEEGIITSRSFDTSSKDNMGSTASTPDQVDQFAGKLVGNEAEQAKIDALTPEGRKVGKNAYPRDTFGFRTEKDLKLTTESDQQPATFNPDLGEERGLKDVLRGDIPDRKDRTTNVEIVKEDGVITDKRTETVDTEPRSRTEFLKEEGLFKGRGDAEDIAGVKVGDEPLNRRDKVKDLVTRKRKGELDLKTKQKDTGSSDTVGISDRVDRIRDRTRKLVGDDTDGDIVSGRRRTGETEFNKPRLDSDVNKDVIAGSGLGLGVGQAFQQDQQNKDDQILQQDQRNKDNQILQQDQKQQQDNPLDQDQGNNDGGFGGGDGDDPFKPVKDDEDTPMIRREDTDGSDRGLDIVSDEEKNKGDNAGLFSTGRKNRKYRASVGAKLIGLTAEKKPEVFQDPTELRPIVEKK